ncbi:archaeal putative transposase [archaeon]|nr:archaeal putative transposase [archaeon]
MLKVVGVPAKLTPVFEEFRDEFTKPSYQSFTQLTGALIMTERSRTVRRLHKSIFGGKSRTAYEYFFNDAKWDEDALSQRKAELFFKEAGLSRGDRLLLIIDDTYVEKKGDKTAGVGKFYDHARGRYITGNNFVTSCLQVDDAYIPHKAKMYLKEDATEALGEEFRTKPEIAYTDLIEPLHVPDGVKLYIIFDSWWYSSVLIQDTLKLGHHVVCQLKNNKKIEGTVNVSELADTVEYHKVKIEVRGKEKVYLASEQIVEIPGLGKVKLVISKREKDKKPKFYMSTDLDSIMKEVLEIYENRWSIELAHSEANQKFGFKEYQIRDKKVIERFMQLSFLVWTIILIAEVTGKDFKTVIKEMKIGDILDEIKLVYFIEMLISLQHIFDSASSREELVERLADLLWD